MYVWTRPVLFLFLIQCRQDGVVRLPHPRLLCERSFLRPGLNARVFHPKKAKRLGYYALESP